MNNFFRKLFRRKKSASIDVKTAPLSEEQLSMVSIQNTPVKKLTPPQLSFASSQSVGMHRDHNEDTLFAISAILADGSVELPFGIFIVADGMGGHLHGEIASTSAARAMGEYLVRTLYPSLMGLNPAPQSESMQEIMESGVREAHQAVTHKAPGGGTTLTAALVIGEQVTLAHIGDSRAYFIYPDGRIQAMTNDHSLVRRMVERGLITQQEAAESNQRNVLYQALGQPEPYRPDIVTFLIPHPGYLLLCSDGLWGEVPDAEIFRIVSSAGSMVEACQQLVDSANASGGPDNISVVLVQYMS